jgi:hypothetical protein
VFIYGVKLTQKGQFESGVGKLNEKQLRDNQEK